MWTCPLVARNQGPWVPSHWCRPSVAMTTSLNWERDMTFFPKLKLHDIVHCVVWISQLMPVHISHITRVRMGVDSVIALFQQRYFKILLIVWFQITWQFAWPAPFYNISTVYVPVSVCVWKACKDLYGTSFLVFQFFAGGRRGWGVSGQRRCPPLTPRENDWKRTFIFELLPFVLLMPAVAS